MTETTEYRNPEQIHFPTLEGQRVFSLTDFNKLKIQDLSPGGYSFSGYTGIDHYSFENKTPLKQFGKEVALGPVESNLKYFLPEFLKSNPDIGNPTIFRYSRTTNSNKVTGAAAVFPDFILMHYQDPTTDRIQSEILRLDPDMSDRLNIDTSRGGLFKKLRSTLTRQVGKTMEKIFGTSSSPNPHPKPVKSNPEILEFQDSINLDEYGKNYRKLEKFALKPTELFIAICLIEQQNSNTLNAERFAEIVKYLKNKRLIHPNDHCFKMTFLDKENKAELKIYDHEDGQLDHYYSFDFNPDKHRGKRKSPLQCTSNPGRINHMKQGEPYLQSYLKFVRNTLGIENPETRRLSFHQAA